MLIFAPGPTCPTILSQKKKQAQQKCQSLKGIKLQKIWILNSEQNKNNLLDKLETESDIDIKNEESKQHDEDNNRRYYVVCDCTLNEKKTRK